MRDNQNVSVQAAMGMMLQGLSEIFPDRKMDTKMLILPLSEYESLLNKASEIKRDEMVKSMKLTIKDQNEDLLQWQTRFRRLEGDMLDLVAENSSLRSKIKSLELRINELNQRKWWQIWKKY